MDTDIPFMRWGVIVDLRTNSTAKLWTDAAVFVDEADVEVLLKRGAINTQVYLKTLSPVGESDDNREARDGALCYLTLLQLNGNAEGFITDSPSVLCKVGSLNDLLQCASISLQLQALRTARGMQPNDTQPPEPLETTSQVPSTESPITSSNYKYCGVINRSYFIDRNVDISRLTLVRFSAEVGPVPFVDEMVLLIDKPRSDEEYSELHCATNHKHEWVSDYEKMMVPISAGMTVQIENMGAKCRILNCLPYSQGILGPKAVICVASINESTFDVGDPSKQTGISDGVNLEDCIVKGMLIRKVSVQTRMLKKYDSKLKSDPETLPCIYADSQFLAQINLPDSSPILLLDDSGAARAARLRGLSNSQPSNLLLIPPLLSHNINLHPNKPSRITLGICSSFPELPIASRVRLGVLNFNKKIHLPLFDEYFSRARRYLVLNDVLSLPLKYDDILRNSDVYETSPALFEYVVLASVLDIDFTGEAHPLLSSGSWVVSSSTKIELQPFPALKVPKYVSSYALSVNLGLVYKLRAEYALRHPFETLQDILVAHNSKEFTIKSFPSTILLKSHNPVCTRSWVYTCADYLGLHVELLNLTDLSVDQRIIEKNVLDALKRACSHIPSILFIPDIDTLHLESELEENNNDGVSFIVKTVTRSIKKRMSNDRLTPVFIAGTSQDAELPSNLEQMFLHIITEEVPTIDQSLSFFTGLLNIFALPSIANFSLIAQKLTGSTYDTLNYIFNCALREAHKRSIARLAYKKADPLRSFGKPSVLLCPVLVDKDFELVVKKNSTPKLSKFDSGADMQKISWDDVGGLRDIKQQVIEAVKLSLHYKNFLPKNLKKTSGMLFYGPPGTGKTFFAKAIASNLGLNLLAVNSPELVSPYIGESESNIRELFATARQLSPCLLFIDELDSISKMRGSSGASGCVNDRLVAQLLAEIDDISSINLQNHDSYVFLIGATNRPDMLDTALLRSGRLNRMIYLGPCESVDEVIYVIKALTRRFDLHSSFSLDTIARNINLPITSADLYGICSQAHLNAIRRIINTINIQDQTKLCSDGESRVTDVIVTSDDFLTAIALHRPSTDLSMFDHYKDFQETLRHHTP